MYKPRTPPRFPKLHKKKPQKSLLYEQRASHPAKINNVIVFQSDLHKIVLEKLHTGTWYVLYEKKAATESKAAAWERIDQYWDVDLAKMEISRLLLR